VSVRVENRDALVSADESGRRALALDMLEGALAAVEPRHATEGALDEAEAKGIPLEGAAIVALGKAAGPMAQAAVERLGSARGVVVSPDASPVEGLDVRLGEHPVSGEAAIANGRALFDFARSVGEGDTVICLVSGGGSAMAELPIDGIDAGTLAVVNRALLASGAPIEVINAVRRRLSRLKGGGLARALAPARIVTVVLSDTPGSPPSTVASGPTLAPDEEPDLSERLVRHGLDVSLPRAAIAALSGPRASSPPVFAEVIVAADNAVARRAAADIARARGVDVVEWEAPFAGEARETGAAFYERARRAGAAIVVAGGETTVTLAGTGRGGRNHEVCLGAHAGYQGGLIVGFGTDGVDGTSDAAGALLDETVMRLGRGLGLDPAALLKANDSAIYFARCGGQIVTGATGTNVADLWLYVR